MQNLLQDHAFHPSRDGVSTGVCEKNSVVPSGASCFSDALRWGAEIFQSLRSRLRDSGHSTAVGDEGGFAPDLSSNENALEVIVESISDTGLKPGVDVLLSVDVAANEFLEANIYCSIKQVMNKYNIPNSFTYTIC